MGYRERLRQLGPFILNKRRLRGRPSHCLPLPDHKTESDSFRWCTEIGGKRLKLQHVQLGLDIKKRFLTLKVVKCWERGPERLWNHHPWKC